MSDGDAVVAVDSAECRRSLVDDVGVQRYSATDQCARLRPLSVLPLYRLHDVPRSRLLRTIQVCQQLRGRRHTSAVVHAHVSPFPQIDIIGSMMIVWRVRGKTVGSVLCSIVYNNCAQCNAHIYEQT